MTGFINEYGETILRDVCLNCGEPLNGGKKYCSMKCRNESDIWKQNIKKSSKDRWKNKPHPRGMLGKRHKHGVMERAINTKIERYGKPTWNKGLTKETDERVEKYGLSGSKTKKGNIKYTKTAMRNLGLEGRIIVSEITEEQSKFYLDSWIKSRLTLKETAERFCMKPDTLSRIIKKHFPVEYEDHAEQSQGKQYKRGRAFEYRTKEHFKRHGYFIMRSPRSGSPVDLVAIRKGEALFIQCKTYKGHFTDKERIELIELSESVGAIPLLVYKEKKTRRLVIQRLYEEKTKLEVWDYKPNKEKEVHYHF